MRKVSVLMLALFVCAPAIGQVPRVKKTIQSTLANLDTEYSDYEAALGAQLTAVQEEKVAYDALVAADQALIQAQAARDQAQTNLDTAKAATDAALQQTTDAHAAVRP